MVAGRAKAGLPLSQASIRLRNSLCQAGPFKEQWSSAFVLLIQQTKFISTQEILNNGIAL